MNGRFIFSEAYRVYNGYAHRLLSEHPTESLTNVVYAFWKYEEEFFVPPMEAFDSIKRMLLAGKLKSPPKPLEEMILAIPEELR